MLYQGLVEGRVRADKPVQDLSVEACTLPVEVAEVWVCDNPRVDVRLWIMPSRVARTDQLGHLIENGH